MRHVQSNRRSLELRDTEVVWSVSGLGLGLDAGTNPNPVPNPDHNPIPNPEPNPSLSPNHNPDPDPNPNPGGGGCESTCGLVLHVGRVQHRTCRMRSPESEAEGLE